MFLSNVSVRRPVAMAALIIVLVIFGGLAFQKLGMDIMPSVEVPYVSITTVVPGANPNEIEVNVARKIEDAVSGVSGLKHVNSSVTDNVCSTLLEFQLDTDVDVAAQDVREKLDTIVNELPSEAERPVISKFDPNAKPVVTIMSLGTMDVDSMFDYIQDKLSSKFSVITGVADVEVTGSDDMEFHIILNRGKLAALGLTANEIAEKIIAANSKIPAGRIKDGRKEVTVTFDAELKNPEDALDIEIGRKAGSRIYLRDVADVVMEAKENRTSAFFDGMNAVRIKIVKKSDANALEVVNSVRRVFDEITSDGTLPGGMRLVWFSDDGEYIMANVRDAWTSIFLGMGITAILLMLFLQDIRSTFIAALSMPVSIIITFAVMNLFGYTFNNMTLLALGTGVGTLVTNSIVVLESIFKKMSQGLNPIEAASSGAGDVAAPVFASAGTNVVVFVPVALMTSIVGRLFTPFAVTMTVATVVSLFVSFTLTPLLASALSASKEKKKRIFFFTRVGEIFNAVYAAFERFYMNGIEHVIKRPWRTVLYSLIMLVLTFVFVAPRVGMSFMPSTDRGEVSVKLEFPTSYNINTTLERARAIDERIRKLPQVVRTALSVGSVQGTIGAPSEGVHLAEISVRTKSKNERPETIEEIRSILRKEVGGELEVLATVNIPSTVGGASSELELEVSGPDLAVLDATVKKLEEALKKRGVATDVDTTARAPREELRVIPNRPVMSDMEIKPSTAGALLRANIDGIKAGTYKSGDRTFDIRVKLQEPESARQLGEYTVGSNAGRPLQFGSLADFTTEGLPIQINRSDKSRIAKLYANPGAGMALSDLVKIIDEEAKNILPPGYKTRFVGQVEKMDESAADFVGALLIAAVLTYLLIAAVMESWVMPFIILFTIPLAFIGMELALMLAGLDLSMMGLLGGVMLIGIIVNNAILIMDDVKINRMKGMTPADSMRDACRSKLRPIVMTSIAALAGILPMAFGTGLGSELRASAGMGIAGGLVSSGILSIYVIPALYVMFAKSKGDKK